ncbi:MAG: hypothetical protein CL946_00980 [Ectothiorhodospiraceae bacterium]|nr:hypothetical protein [Ectothiorhodospiraceae bacterium]
MLRFLTILTLTITFTVPIFCQTTITVDPNAANESPTVKRTIMGAINVAQPGDKVKVLPGTYFEKIQLADKYITVEGSGAEMTTIFSLSNDYAVDMQTGKLKWFQISSSGDGVYLRGDAFITNCVIEACNGSGLYLDENAVVHQCLVQNNGGTGVYFATSSPTVTNVISVGNVVHGFYGGSSFGYYNIDYCASFGNGKNDLWFNKGGHFIETDPKIVEGQYNLASSSDCRNSGNPGLKDPDGSSSSMGYYGGPEAPTFPVIIEATPVLNADGTITIKAKAVSRY